MADKKLKHVLGMKSNSQSRTVEEKEEILKNLSEKLHFFQRKVKRNLFFKRNLYEILIRCRQ